MHTGIILITLFTMLLPASQPSSASCSTYHVSKVLRVVWPDYFECRLSNYTPSQAVRFRVYWKDISPSPTDQPTQQFITELLTSADHIELYDIHFRNYFRVNAKIRIDGKPLTDILISQAILPANQDQTKAVNESAAEQNYSIRYPTRRYQESVSPQPSHSISEQKRFVNIQDLLETEVDCSMMTDETSFAEALDILSTSVDPPLPLVVFWSDLKTNSYIDKDTPIGISGLGRMKVAGALKMILRSVSLSGPKLAVVAEGGILTLGTQQTLARDKTTQVYSIEDLLSVPSLVDELFGTGAGTQTQGFRR